MISVAEAQAIILSALPDWGEESVPLDQAHGRVLRAPLAADRDQPPFDRVMMDGIAFSFAEFARGRRTFAVQAAQGAGQPSLTLESGGHCIEIMTGAILPQGCDCILPVEKISVSDDRAIVADGAEPKVMACIHRQGSDYRRDDELLETGVLLRYPEIAIAASIGQKNLTVARLPRVAVVASGDELVDVHEPVLPYQIRRSNDYAIAAALDTAGFGKSERFHVADDPAPIEACIAELLQRFDVLVLTGGVSMGKYDYLPAVLESQRVSLEFHKVAQRPGKPMWFGMGPKRQAVFALPGNPVSALSCLRRHVLPALSQACGASQWAPPRIALMEEVQFGPQLAWFLPVQLVFDKNGATSARPRPTNTSGDFAGLRKTHGFVELPATHTVFPAGFVADYYPW